MRTAGLCNTKHVTAEEQLAIFLYLCTTGATNQERFQRSPDTISKSVLLLQYTAQNFITLTVFRIIHVLEMIISQPFYTQYVQLPADGVTPPEIANNSKLFPFLKDCRGATDGTHIDAFVPDEALARYRSRKGGISQNVLAACSFDLRFLYVLAGWEGSVADSVLWEDARSSNFPISPGTYYLADAGFPSCDALLVPYQNTRYHLKEWYRAPQKYILNQHSYL
jgi:hypothetical protein